MWKLGAMWQPGQWRAIHCDLWHEKRLLTAGDGLCRGGNHFGLDWIGLDPNCWGELQDKTSFEEYPA